MSKVCDYSGYACKCKGYEKAGNGTTRCVCGHSKAQHNSTGAVKSENQVFFSPTQRKLNQ
jgi:hypothetical protein